MHDNFDLSCNSVIQKAKSIAVLKVNPISTSKEMRPEVIENSFGHSKVVLPSGMVVSVNVHPTPPVSYYDKFLSFINF